MHMYVPLDSKFREALLQSQQLAVQSQRTITFGPCLEISNFNGSKVRGPLIVQNQYTNMVALAKKITCTIRINNNPNLSFVDMLIK